LTQAWKTDSKKMPSKGSDRREVNCQGRVGRAKLNGRRIRRSWLPKQQGPASQANSTRRPIFAPDAQPVFFKSWRQAQSRPAAKGDDPRTAVSWMKIIDAATLRRTYGGERSRREREKKGTGALNRARTAALRIGRSSSATACKDCRNKNQFKPSNGEKQWRQA